MNALVIGPPKTGKTRSLDTLLGNTAIFSSDPGGYESLRRPYKLMPPGSKDDLCLALKDNECVVVDYCQAPRDLSLQMTREARSSNEAWMMFGQDLNVMLKCGDCQNLVIDGLTGLSDLILNAVLVMNKATNKSNLQAYFGDAIEKIKEITSICCANPRHFIMLAHTVLEKDELSGKLVERPLVYGKKLPDELMAMFSTIFRTDVMQGSYTWLTKPTGLLESIGSRIKDGLPQRIPQDFKALL